MIFIKFFFTKLYRKYDESLLEFRKRILKTIQIGSSVLIIIFMIIAFPFRIVPNTYYIVLPLYLILNNGISYLLQKKRFEKFCPYYLLVLQILGQAMSIELSITLCDYTGNIFKIYFLGVYTGFTIILGFLNFSSSWHKIVISLMLLIHLVLRQIQLDLDRLFFRLPFFLGTFIFINWVFFKTEVVFFEVWASWMKKSDSLQHFQMLVENFPSQIIVLDNSSLDLDKAIYCNKEAELSLEETIETSKSLLAFLESFKVIKERKEASEEFGQRRNSLRRPDSLREKILECLKNGYSNGLDFKVFVCVKGKHDKWEAKIGWIEWNQKEAMMMIFNDLSKTEKIKELQILDENKNKTLAKVSHELRTPINGIIGMIESARSNLCEGNIADLKNCLDIAENSAKTLLLMVNDILDFEQIRNGKLRLNIESKSVKEIIEKVLPLIEVQVRNKKNLQLIYHDECPENTKVFADPGRLQQILWNLLWNACKFTSSGYVKLSTRLQTQSEAKPEGLKEDFYPKDDEVAEKNNALEAHREPEYLVEFAVEDTGRGIEAHSMAELFTDFGKLETGCNPTGVGLGLAVCQSLAKQMSSPGINVVSEYGKGSRFFFSLSGLVNRDCEWSVSSELPAKPAKAEKTLEFFKIDAGEHEKLLSRASRILMVDDDLVNHLVFDVYFKELRGKCSTDKVFNGEEAIRIIQEKASLGVFYDVVMMDCNMPILDGFEATRSIEKMVAAGKIPKLKIIGITADHSASEKKHCLEVGMHDVWTKPISKSDFLRNLNKLIS